MSTKINVSCFFMCFVFTAIIGVVFMYNLRCNNRGRIKYKPCNSNKLYKLLYQEIVELFIDNYHGVLIKLRYIWKLIIFIHYDHDFILGNKIESNIFQTRSTVMIGLYSLLPLHGLYLILSLSLSLSLSLYIYIYICLII